MNTIIIEVLGGVAEVTASTIEAQVVLVDWDNIKAGDSHPMELVVLAQPPAEVAAKLRAIADQIRASKEGDGEV